MNNFKIVVAYDGTDYEGWQIQPHGNTIADVLQSTFNDVFNTQVSLLGASRTDAGVHALGQVARCSVDFDITAQALKYAWNNRLPSSIYIRSCELIKDFHPHKNVKQKTYWYHVFTKRPLPFIVRYGYFMSYPIDQEKLQSALSLFIGTHDFRSFCTGDEQENTIRTIDDISVHYIRKYEAYRIAVKGERFLKYMIRRLVGAGLFVATHKNAEIGLISEVLGAKNPTHTLPTAPAKGLLLRKIEYKNPLISN